MKKRYIEALKLLALDWKSQMNCFPSYVHVPDEIALTFDNEVYQQKDNLTLTLKQLNAVCLINKIFEQMSANKDLWTLDLLEKSQEWEQIRKLSNKILLESNVKLTAPDLFWLTFIRSPKIG